MKEKMKERSKLKRVEEVLLQRLVELIDGMIRVGVVLL